MIFHENRLLADDSHEVSYLIFFQKIGKDVANLSSAAVVIGAYGWKFSAPGCDNTLTEMGTLQSPAYGSLIGYPGVMECKWTLKAPSSDRSITLVFETFELEKDEDFLHVSKPLYFWIGILWPVYMYIHVIYRCLQVSECDIFVPAEYAQKSITYTDWCIQGTEM